MKLYGSKNSRSLRCAWALEEAGATYDYQRIWLMKGEGHSPAFKAINPAGKIPVLIDGDITLTESAAIVMYVAEKFPDARLMPTDVAQRAEVFRWIFYIATEVEPHLWAIAQHRFALPEDKRVPAVEPTCAWQLQRALRALEKSLTTHQFIAGGAFSVADILATHCMTWALSAKLDGVGEASLAYIARMKARTAFQRAVARETIEAECAEALQQATGKPG
jgi:glutathione S-transferase